MNKAQLLEKLNKELSRLPAEELESQLAFYGEMIDDRIEEGLSEEEAVAAIGNVDDIIAQLKSEYPNTKKSAPKQDKRKMSAWAIILITLGSPIWISLGAAAFVILLATYTVIWAVAGSLWSLPVSLCGVSLGGIALGVVTIVYGNAFLGIAIIGAAIASAGLAIFAGFGCFHLTRLAAFLTKTITKATISLFKRKEKNNA